MDTVVAILLPVSKVLLSKLVSSSWRLLGNVLVVFGELCFTGRRDWNLVDDLDGMGGRKFTLAMELKSREVTS